MQLDLVPLWAAILALAVFMYVLLDGFDLGVGMLFALRRDPHDRDLMMASVSPVWDFNETWLTLFIVVIVFLYCTTGGLEAAVWTDTVQGVLIVVLSVLLIPFAMVKLNAMHGLSGIGATGQLLHQELPSYFFSLLGSPQALDFTWYFIVALSVMVSITPAIASRRSTRAVLSTVTATRSRVVVRNPCIVALTVYGPGCRSGTV